MKTLKKFLGNPAGPFWMAALMLLTTSMALADVTETEEYEFVLNEGGRLSLSNINGDVRIKGIAGNQVKIIATKKAGSQEYLDDMKVVIAATESRISVETKYPENDGEWSWNDSNKGSVDYEITVPFNTELDSIETVNGGVGISAVKGSIDVESVNGKLELSMLTGDVSMDTVNGGIDAQFDVLGASQRIKAEAVNGGITLRLPGDASAQVTAETLNGSIDADDFGLEPDRGFVGRDLEGQIGGGEARVSIETVNGSIDIERSP